MDACLEHRVVQVNQAQKNAYSMYVCMKNSKTDKTDLW